MKKNFQNDWRMSFTCTCNFQWAVFHEFVIRRRNAGICLAKKPSIIASVIRRIFIIYTFQVHCCYVTRNPGVQVIETFFFEVVCYLGQNDSSSKPKRLQAGVNIISIVFSHVMILEMSYHPYSLAFVF